eukprot:TRINITY_DN32442_c0_g1_i1.p1 TRINITY_DN32442_c0_g1~~TRINITY_DN32442_c0_g1_i1.p1  ORF type:complete len:862 (+),score=118.06 TRINITY_DN32442_c0_g1_i1:93-2678(+)
MSRHHESTTQVWAKRYAGFLSSYRVCVATVFLLATVLGACLAPMFVARMTSSVPATEGTYSKTANRMIDKLFPDKIDEVNDVVVLYCRDGGLVTAPAPLGCREAVGNLTAHLVRRINKTEAINHVDCSDCYADLPQLQKTFISKDGATTFLAVNYVISKLHVGPLIRESLASVEPWIDEQVVVRVTGIEDIDESVIAGVISNLQYVDSVAMPLALILLGLVVREWRLMFLPILAVVVSAALSFGVFMYPLSYLHDVFVLAASIMMTLNVAMNIDYSLFFLTRYKAELQASLKTVPLERVEHAIAVTIWSAGHTILTSGTTLVLAFAGLLLTFDPFMISVGMASSAAICSSMLSSLVLTPTILLMFPTFFGQFTSPGKRPLPTSADCDERNLEQAFELGEIYPTDDEDSPADKRVVSRDEILEKRVAKLQASVWYRFGLLILNNKCLVSTLLTLLFLPAVARLPAFEINKSPLPGVPRGTDAWFGYMRLQESFGAGMLYPTKLLVVPKHAPSVFTPRVFNRAAKAIDGLSESLPALPNYTVQSLFYSSEVGPIPLTSVKAALHMHEGQGSELAKMAADAESYMLCNVTSPEACSLLRLARDRFVNTAGTAMIASMSLSDDPFSAAGLAWTYALRRALPTEGPNSYFVVSNPSSVSDTVETLYSSAPLIITVTMIVFFFVVCLSFRSLVIPVRLLPSVGLTVLWTYGLATLVYKDGILAWLGIPALAPIPGDFALGVSWPVPVLCFTILAGLCLDYDIFVLNSISEFRLAGFSDRDSILLGLCSTGHTITVAGLIMLVAFSGLLLSGQMLLNQMAFFLTTCVFLDTFIVRTIVVPICMDALSGFSNWWPKKMPPVTRTLEAGR